MSEFNSKFIKYLCLLLFLKGCAYFNTFYNAEEHYDLAERIRIENLGNQIPYFSVKAKISSRLCLEDTALPNYWR